MQTARGGGRRRSARRAPWGSNLCTMASASTTRGPASPVSCPAPPASCPASNSAYQKLVVAGLVTVAAAAVLVWPHSAPGLWLSEWACLNRLPTFGLGLAPPPVCEPCGPVCEPCGLSNKIFLPRRPAGTRSHLPTRRSYFCTFAVPTPHPSISRPPLWPRRTHVEGGLRRGPPGPLRCGLARHRAGNSWF